MARNEKYLERREELGVRKDRDGRVVSVKTDRHILDPESPLAVQIPDTIRQENPLDALDEDEYVDHEAEAQRERAAEEKREAKNNS